MKTRQSPLTIILKDLPPDGRDFSFTKETGELNGILKDLIGSNAFSVNFHIAPMGNTYDLKGQVITELDQQCSLCANDFKFPVRLNLHELIVIEKALGKGDQTSKANHAHEWDASAPDYIVLPSEQFHVGDYVHEAIGLAEPIRPLCAPERPEGCLHGTERLVDRPWLSYGEKEKAEAKIHSNPFQVLEKMKLKS